MARTRKPQLVRSLTALGVATGSVDAVLSMFRALTAIRAGLPGCAVLTIVIGRQDRPTGSPGKITV